MQQRHRLRRALGCSQSIPRRRDGRENDNHPDKNCQDEQQPFTDTGQAAVRHYENQHANAGYESDKRRQAHVECTKLKHPLVVVDSVCLFYLTMKTAMRTPLLKGGEYVGVDLVTEFVVAVHLCLNRKVV